MGIPQDHAQRHALANEVHARPPARLRAPELVSHLTLVTDAADREREAEVLRALGERTGVPIAVPPANHLFVDCGAFRLKWERHTEFTEYTFFRRAAGAHEDATALDAVPQEWLRSLPGRTLAAAHVLLAKADGGVAADAEALRRHFAGNVPMGSAVADDAAHVFTDFRVHADGFSRVLVHDRGLSEERVGRLVQRLLEIESYRMMALLAFPLARELSARLRGAEERLARHMEELQRAAHGESASVEARMFGELTSLAGEVERVVSASSFRFSAARAYNELVNARVAELRESRLAGFQTWGEFLGRRLAPAMATCEAVARRQEELSTRVARASELLRTRVDVVREAQNQALLASMNQRAHLQLRLQQTVEGLSVAAITYYCAALVGYLAKAAASSGLRLDPDLAVACSIPVIGVLVWLGVRRLRRRLARAEQTPLEL
jgi:uncharacterized membrane-anchored protein